MMVFLLPDFVMTTLITAITVIAFAIAWWHNVLPD